MSRLIIVSNRLPFTLRQRGTSIESTPSSGGLVTALGAYEMYAVLEVGGLTLPETAILVLFVLLFSWIAFSFSSATFGFLSALTGTDRALGVDPKMPLPRLRSRIALLLPTYNEDPGPVMARLQAMQDSIDTSAASGRSPPYVSLMPVNPSVVFSSTMVRSAYGAWRP